MEKFLKLRLVDSNMLRLVGIAVILAILAIIFFWLFYNARRFLVTVLAITMIAFFGQLVIDEVFPDLLALLGGLAIYFLISSLIITKLLNYESNDIIREMAIAIAIFGGLFLFFVLLQLKFICALSEIIFVFILIAAITCAIVLWVADHF